MKFSYVLPDPNSYEDRAEFDDDLARVAQSGYDAVELQIPDPTPCDEDRLRKSLQKAGLGMCAFQTGSTYSTRGNCLCSADPAVRRRTEDLLTSFVDLAARWNSILVFGSLQGQKKDESDLRAGWGRIRDALVRVGSCAAEKNVIIAYEPVNHLETAYNNTIQQAQGFVRTVNSPGVKIMVDTFHMNIEETSMLTPLAYVADLLVHVHLSETNRGPLGEGHFDTASFLHELQRLKYSGYCSIGVYNSHLPRRRCIARCAEVVRDALA